MMKYPRTPPLHCSENIASDDLNIRHTQFVGMEVVAMLKMDGENCSITSEKVWARSLDSNANDEGRRWCDRLRQRIATKLAKYRLCGENLFFVHTEQYGENNRLYSPFYAFSLWEDDLCLDFDWTEMFISDLGLIMPTIIYRGIYDADKILAAYEPYRNNAEGFVVRNVQAFTYNEFANNVAKFVKKEFVIPDAHWSKNKIPNRFYDANGNEINAWEIW